MRLLFPFPFFVVAPFQLQLLLHLVPVLYALGTKYLSAALESVVHVKIVNYISSRRRMLYDYYPAVLVVLIVFIASQLL